VSKSSSRRLFIRVICTDMYINRYTGTQGARHQQFRLGRLPVFVEQDQDGNALPGTEYVGYPPGVHIYPRTVRRCPQCGRAFPGAPVPERYSDEERAWRRIVRHWLNTQPKRSVLVVDISDPTYSW
jgi:hypothetical protein